uniref:hypothetical protein n=1 Tax=Mariniflexile sp. TaxID=1979402 RepID=UPI004048D8E7
MILILFFSIQIYIIHDIFIRFFIPGYMVMERRLPHHTKSIIPDSCTNLDEVVLNAAIKPDSYLI